MDTWQGHARTVVLWACGSHETDGSRRGSYGSLRFALPDPPLSMIKATRRAPRADACARPPAWEPGPARAGPDVPQADDQSGSLATQADAVFLAGQLSRSRPPRRGRSLRSRCTRSASPNLDPASARQGFGACRGIREPGRIPPLRARSLSQVIRAGVVSSSAAHANR